MLLTRPDKHTRRWKARGEGGREVRRGKKKLRKSNQLTKSTWRKLEKMKYSRKREVERQRERELSSR